MTRTIEPSIYRDEFFTSLNLIERHVWLGILIVSADDQGRLPDKETFIRSDIFPDDDISLTQLREALDKFISQGKLHAYSRDGKKLLQVVNWWKYQSSASWMGASSLPSPENWIDRVRCHTKGNEIKTINWNHPGGFNGHHPTELPSMLPSDEKEGSELPSREVEGEGEGEGEGDGEVEQSRRTKAQIKADRLTADISKSDLIPLLKLKRFDQALTLDQEIHASDLLAEYARNLSRKDNGKVREPGSITGMNLMKHEYPGDDWYKVAAWDILPEEAKDLIKLEDIKGRAYSVGLVDLGINQ
jgi:hypothetical protein